MSINNRMFLLAVNNVRVLVIFKKKNCNYMQEEKELEYIFLDIYFTYNRLNGTSVCFKSKYIYSCIIITI